MRRLAKGWTALVCAVALMGAGAVLVRPAAAAVGIDWGSVWRHRLEPRAEFRFYTKARADHRFAPKPRVLRGEFNLEGNVATGDEILSSDISWGWDIGRAPRVHVIKPFAKARHGCFGTVNHPNARRGNLCIFERFKDTHNGPLRVCNSFNDCPAADPFGTTLILFAKTSGIVDIDGTWAVRPRFHVHASRQVHAPARGGPLGRR